MNRIRTCLLHLRLPGAVLVASLLGAASLNAATFGQWDFNSGDLSATTGSALTYADGTTSAGTVFNTTTGFSIPDINGSPAAVMKFLAWNNGSGYNMPTPPATVGSSFADYYTILYDVLYGSESDAKLRPLIETDGGFVVPGADLGVSAANGVGLVGGNSFGTINSNTWYRVGFVVLTNTVRMYVNGAQVGQQNLTGIQDGRLVLTPSSTALILANTGTNAAAVGYVNSIQIRDEILDYRQMRAMGGPSAAGIPGTVPPIPSFIDKWIPSGAYANRNTDVGAVIDDGDTTISPASISLRLDGTLMSSASITQVGDLITVKTNLGNLSLGLHTLQLVYTDSTSATPQTNTTTFVALLFYEDFEGLVLGATVDEDIPGTAVWTNRPPTGWSVDTNGVPGASDPAADGTTEWAGWGFANKDWWASTAGGQNRELWVNGQGTVAIADPDEWDDHAPHALGYMTTYLQTPAINIAGLTVNSVFMKFDSSWRPEAQDDCGGAEWPPCPATNNQTAIITASFNGGAPVQVMKWDSIAGPTFHPDSENEVVTILLNNPSGATNVVLKFGMVNAANDWWWALDNIQVSAGPAITTQPASILRDAGAAASFSVVAVGSGTVTYQWQFNGGSGSVYTNVPGATSAAYNFTAETNNAGGYRVLVTDAISTTISSVASLTVIAAPTFISHPIQRTINAGVDVYFTANARGRSPISYQWTYNGSPISGATRTAYSIYDAQTSSEGNYACLASNSDAVVSSIVATLKFATNIMRDLVLHLKFDGDYLDASGHGNDAIPVNSPTFGTGKIGSALEVNVDGPLTVNNYASLVVTNQPDLQLGTSTSFSVSFWTRVLSSSSDPSFISNKDWDSGSTCGWVVATDGDKRLQWNYRELDSAPNLNTRKDYDGPGGTFSDTNAWRHVAVVYNRGGGGAARAGTYLDGNLVAVTTLATANGTMGGHYQPTTIDTYPLNARSSTAKALNIGQDGSGAYNGAPINALIDDLGLWRRALTPGEVAAIYTAGSAGNTLTTAAPVTNPRPLDPSISISGANLVITKGNTVLESATSVTGPWAEVTAARSTNSYVTPLPAAPVYYRGGQP